MEFFDQFEHTIDDKGRLVLPAAYREAFVSGGFLTLLGDNAALFTRDGWDTYRRKLALTGSFTRHQLQFIYGSASPFTPDSQHRIVVNSRVRAKAGLEREVVVVGSGSHAAIYPRTTWARIEEEANAPDDSGLTLTDKFNALDFL